MNPRKLSPLEKAERAERIRAYRADAETKRQEADALGTGALIGLAAQGPAAAATLAAGALALRSTAAELDARAAAIEGKADVLGGVNARCPGCGVADRVHMDWCPDVEAFGESASL